MAELVIATRSAHKLAEIAAILPPIPGLSLLSLDDAGVVPTAEEDRVEVFDTFEENALAKARFYAARSGRPVLADDSGLCVDALGGAPGVRSKRFSGRTDLTGKALDLANNALLLDRLQGLPPGARTARYVCVVALADGSGFEATFRGTCSGIILDEPRGGGGFGYDPLFLIPERGMTFGEMEPAEKNRISHRAEAVRAAAAELSAWLGSRRHPKQDGRDTPIR